MSSNEIPDWAYVLAFDMAYPAEVKLKSDSQKIREMQNLTVTEAFARYVAEHETQPEPPIEPDVRLVADIINAFENPVWVRDDTALKNYREHVDRAVEVYRAHRLKEMMDAASPAEPEADADSWIPWSGGKCPVWNDTLVDVVTAIFAFMVPPVF